MSVFRLDAHAPTFPASGDYWIAQSAIVIGEVRFASDVSVWFGAVVRADDETIDLGQGTNVQDNSVLHADPGFPISVGTFCTIGHNAIVHGCTIGDETLIGMGARVLNGARIGSRCLIGAGAVVAENAIIPDDSLVLGVPGKVVRSIDAPMLARIRLSAQRYISWWRRYRDGLTALEQVR